ncbi:homoserine kinase [Georgenia sp. H159]|uniref:homoserine kinase n=1 Tax=Georgenia sp. H159 TaxID=3076115 RepID=UPI002D792553|nr:homoserine kinase [Georgenia sp. H159]
MARLARDTVRVEVPATSANLGPGFDALGIALGIVDDIDVRATTGLTHVTVTGSGAGSLPEGENHLVVRAVRAALDHAGAPQAGLELRCHNRIPHGRGLGSSAAAVVGGLVAARGLVAEPEALDDDTVLALATEFEGHPDNAAPAILGGATVAWSDARGPRAARLDVGPHVRPTVLVPPGELLTGTARSVLPRQVSHEDASFNAGRSALLVLALDQRPDLLLPATEDRLHQRQRAVVMEESLRVVDTLRELGLPAVVSGAGPSVLVLAETDEAHVAAFVRHGWRVYTPGVADRGARIVTGD